MNEATLKGKLMKALARDFPRAVAIRHEDRIRHGVPDISFTYERTLWFEVKYANPRCESKAIQDLTCLKLAAAARNCWHIIYFDYRGSRATFVCSPKAVLNEVWESDYLVRADGFDHGLITRFIRQELQLSDDQK